MAAHLWQSACNCLCYATDQWPIIAVCYLKAAMASKVRTKALVCGASVVLLPDDYKKPPDE